MKGIILSSLLVELLYLFNYILHILIDLQKVSIKYTPTHFWKIKMGGQRDKVKKYYLLQEIHALKINILRHTPCCLFHRAIPVDKLTVIASLKIQRRTRWYSISQPFQFFPILQALERITLKVV